MTVLKGIISTYRAGEEKPIERYKARIQIKEEHHSIYTAFKRNMIDFLGLNDQAKKFGLGSFDLKLYRLVKIHIDPAAARSGITPVAWLRW